MKRNIIKIDQEKCNGCGLCIQACQEGALKLINGKAVLISESYCDGLGHCLPECPMQAITVEEREALPFDEQTVNANLKKASANTFHCPGTKVKLNESNSNKQLQNNLPKQASKLKQWPCQIKLVPINAPFFNNAHLLIAADCTAFAYANIHQDFMQNKVTLIGCPKLDNIDYTNKLSEILMQNEILSVSVLRMEVPCCNGLVQALKNALSFSKKIIPWSITTISIEGEILQD